MSPSENFIQKKRQILDALSAEIYTDASPKGSIDEPIRGLVDHINNYDDLVTTSSCSGRISVFLEGTGSGGKGARSGEDAAAKGQWLFVSHRPVPTDASERGSETQVVVNEVSTRAFPESSDTRTSGYWQDVFQLSALAPGRNIPTVSRFVHLKFEPMILHVLCASSVAADKLLKCAQQAGFRESGASNVPASSDVPVNVAIRTAGLSFDNVIGFYTRIDGNIEMCSSVVSEEVLETLVSISNVRFKTNSERMQRLNLMVGRAFGAREASEWEDPEVRRERKRRAGLQRRLEQKSEAEEPVREK